MLDGILSPDAALAELLGDDTRKRAMKKGDKKTTAAAAAPTARVGSAGKTRTPVTAQGKRGSVVAKKPGTAAGPVAADPAKVSALHMAHERMMQIMLCYQRCYCMQCCIIV